MRSILRQLRKYRSREPEKPKEKSEDERSREVYPGGYTEEDKELSESTERGIEKSSKELAHPGGYNLKHVATELGVGVLKFKGMPDYPYANVLYPYRLQCMYWLILKKGMSLGMDAESKCNQLIEDFMNERIADIGLRGYLDLFKKAMTDGIRKVIMCRVLVATFAAGDKKMDKLPKELRSYACEYLKIPSWSMNLSQSLDLIELMSRNAEIEELILGRLGYLMVWKELVKSGDVSGYISTMKEITS